MTVEAHALRSGGRTIWARNRAAPVRRFLNTETDGAFMMLSAVIAALVWVNVSPHSYEALWRTRLAFTMGGTAIAADLRHWVNEGLMTFFFLVVGLEAKRQVDLGELRERRRLAIPVLAAFGGLAVPMLIYLAFNAGGPGRHGWGVAMSTDTAFALATVAMVTPRTLIRIRVFLLTLAVVDDLAGLVVITVAYSTRISGLALGIAVALFAALVALRYLPAGRRPLSAGIGVAIWVAMFKSGIDPVISGLAIGLAISAYPPSREDLERTTALARSFREQPTPELARSAQQSVQSALSLNERLQYGLRPWTTYVIAPLFAFANGGIHVTGKLMSDASSSPITVGILVAYVVGKPIGVFAGSWLASRPALHGPRSPLSSPALVAAGACAGIGFTVSLLVASLAFTGERLNEARLGVLATVVVAPPVARMIRMIVQRLPSDVRARQVGRTAEDIFDLSVDVDPERDHIRGPEDASVTLLEYGDFQCPQCRRAEHVIRQLLAEQRDDVRYVWRHLPLNDVHPHAQLAAEASEAAGAQGKFWEMHDVLLANQENLTSRDIARYASDLGLDVGRFTDDLRRRAYASRVGEDVAGADESGVSGTPTFFINGLRHYGAYSGKNLTQAVQTAKTRARWLAAAAAGPEA